MESSRDPRYKEHKLRSSLHSSKGRKNTVCSKGPGQACEARMENGVLGHGSSLRLCGFQHAVSAMALERASRPPLHKDLSPLILTEMY